MNLPLCLLAAALALTAGLVRAEEFKFDASEFDKKPVEFTGYTQVSGEGRVGGLLVGILEAMGAGYISSAYKDAIPFVLILFILFFMPRGLFGGKSTDRV